MSRFSRALSETKPSPQPAKPGHRPDAPRFRLEIAVSARRQSRDIPAEDWSFLLHRLLELARSMGTDAPPSREALAAAGVDPPYLRIRAGNYVLVCDANPRAGRVTVFHILPRASGTSGAVAAA